MTKPKKVNKEEVLAPFKSREEYKKELKQKLMKKMGEAQAVLLLQKTPNSEVRKRLMNPSKAKGPYNPEFSYLEHAYVEETLNFAFQMDWDAVITKSERIGEEAYVEGYLEVRFQDGTKVRKTGFGGAMHRNNPNMSWGDVFKAAYSDMIKNAATKFGLGLDLYRHEEKVIEKTIGVQKDKAGVVTTEKVAGVKSSVDIAKMREGLK